MTDGFCGGCAVQQLPSFSHNENMGNVRCEAASVDGLVQQLACNLINHGYWFYYRGMVPAGKDPRAVDAKLVELYELHLDKFARARRKKAGEANAALLRYGREFILICTDGKHQLHTDHKLKDIRRQPIHFHGYSIGCGKGSDGRYHASVRIGDEAMAELVAYFEGIALRKTERELAEELARIRFQPYARVRRQMLRLLRIVNEKRRTQGLSILSISTLELRRQVVRVFTDREDIASAA